MSAAPSSRENFGEDMFPASSIPMPPELKVRTMASDVVELTKSGGVLPQGEIIAGPKPPAKKIEEPPGFWETHSKQIARIFLLVGFLGIAAVLYVGYRSFLDFFTLPPFPQEEAPPAATSSEPIGETTFMHESFFRISPDETKIFRFFRNPVTDVSELLSYEEKMKRIISGATAAGRFVEIEFRWDDGEPISITQFLSLRELPLYDESFLRGSFEPDFTAFVSREGGRAFPGFILRLRKGVASVLIQKEVRGIEDSPVLERLFLEAPGVRSAAAFADRQIEGKVVRTLPFDTRKGEVFLYGWFNANHLVFATSEEGIREAFEHLGR